MSSLREAALEREKVVRLKADSQREEGEEKKEEWREKKRQDWFEFVLPDIQEVLGDEWEWEIVGSSKISVWDEVPPDYLIIRSTDGVELEVRISRYRNGKDEDGNRIYKNGFSGIFYKGEFVRSLAALGGYIKAFERIEELGI